MIILATDTSSKISAAALAGYTDGRLSLLAEIRSGGARTHSETLLPCIDALLHTAGLSVRDIDIYTPAAGPGSFTGIRINVSAVKGLAFYDGADEEPQNVCPVSSLEALAYAYFGQKSQSGTLIVPVIDARRTQVYTASFILSPEGGLERYTPDRLLTAAALGAELESYGGNIIFCGDACDMCYNIVKGKSAVRASFAASHPSAFALALAAVHGHGLRLIPASKLAPSYLIKPEAERAFDI